jgi:hypothetical protein
MLRYVHADEEEGEQ